MKIRPVATELFHADGRTDGQDETNSRFLQFRERAVYSTQLEILLSGCILVICLKMPAVVNFTTSSPRGTILKK